MGVERGEDAVELTRRFARERELANVEVLHADARKTGLPRRSFDLATARLVLVNVPNPEEIVAEMIARWSTSIHPSMAGGQFSCSSSRTCAPAS